MAANDKYWPTIATANVWARLHLSLGESLLYDHEQNRLFIQDICAYHLYTIDLNEDPDLKDVRRVSLEDDLGMIALIDGDPEHLIASAKRGVARVNIKTGALTYLCRYNEPKVEDLYRANDGCIDPRGRLWSGTHRNFLDEKSSGMDDTPKDGFLFRFDPDGTLHRVLEGMAAPNGMNFSNDHKTFYVTDSFYHCIFAYDYDVETGTISRERRLIEFNRSLGVPDGSHINVNDEIYVAMAFGESNVLVVDPGNRGEGDGRVIGQIDVDALMVVCPTFGGADMKDLYIGTASIDRMVPGIKEKDKNCGSIFKMRTDTPGVRRPKFGPFASGVADNNEAYHELSRSPFSLGRLGEHTAPQPCGSTGE